MFTSIMAPLALSGGQIAFADTKSEIQSGVCEAAGTTDSQGNPICNSSSSPGNVDSTASTIVNILSAIAGVAAVIMIIIGGLRYVTSAGNADTAKNAKNTILYAVVGLIIVALAQLIVHFVLNQTSTGTNSNSSGSGSSGSGSGVHTGAGPGERPN